MTPEVILGSATATTTPVSCTMRVKVACMVCDLKVTPAPASVIGQCTYYYRPLHKEYSAKGPMEKIKQWVAGFSWFGEDGSAHEVAEAILGQREELIKADSQSPEWSRHANFMVRHVGCTHRPPDYYVSYGYYYCSTYGVKLAPKLSAQGKAWLFDARELLQKNMEKGLEQNTKGKGIAIPCKRFPDESFYMSCTQYNLETTPELFKTFAFGTHVPAYLDAGLSDLPMDDLLAIGGQPNKEEWLDADTWVQAGKSGRTVVTDKVRHLAEMVRHLADKAQYLADEVGEGVRRILMVRRTLNRLLDYLR